MSTLSLQPTVFTILRDLIEERCGIHYQPGELPLLAEKISPRAVEAGFDSLLDYYYFLRYDPGGGQELKALIDLLVVNETYFFRELSALEVLVDQVIAPAVARGERPRVWSAACSTGEEPLTLAMVLAQRGLLGSVELLASDVSERVLERARSGTFGRRALREEIPARYAPFISVRDGVVVVAPAVGEAVRFRNVNLIAPPDPEQLLRFEAIVCRNVLIYFTDATTQLVVANLAAQLRPNGTLLVGTSESLLRFGTEFECEERAGVFFYRKGGA
jgi:chemotaxis protein methyltransferase CheR